jgi:protein-disulfide isomerase
MMMKRRGLWPTALCCSLFFLFGGWNVRAAPCDGFSAEKKKLAENLFRATYPYDCCDETLDRCLKAKRVCRLAERLRDDICRRVARGEDEALVKQALERRAHSMVSAGKKAGFDLSHSEAAGEPKAPVQIVAYACARCPFCKKVIPELYGLVTTGPLKGKSVLYFRPYPIRGHGGSVEGGLAFLAAQQLKKQWPFILKLFAEFDRFEEKRLPEWAAQIGLDRSAFAKELASPALRQILVDSKKEGLRNGVDATPTLFINGRRYHGTLDRDTLLDVLTEELDRVQKRIFVEK